MYVDSIANLQKEKFNFYKSEQFCTCTLKGESKEELRWVRLSTWLARNINPNQL